MAIDLSISHLENALGLVNDWLRFAEAKNGAILGVALAVSFGVVRTLPEGFWTHHGLLQLYVFALLAQMFAAVVVSLVSFLPITDIGRLLPRGAKDQSDNLLFFGDLSKYSPEHLCSELNSRVDRDGVEPTRLELDLAGQVIANARIATLKFACSKWSIRLALSAALTPIVVWPGISWAARRP